MNPATTDMKDFLIANSSLVFGVDLFIGTSPVRDNITISLFDSPGTQDDPTFIQQPNIHIFCRGEKGGYEESWNKINEVIVLLSSISNQIINSTNYLLVWKMSGPFHIGNDIKERPLFSATLMVKRREVQ